MDITSNNEIIEMYNRKKLRAKFTLGYWLWLKVPAVNLLRTARNIILLIGLALPLHAIYIALQILGKLFIRLPKRSGLITLTRPSDRTRNLPMSIIRFDRGGVR